MGQYIQTETRGRVVVAKLSNPPHALLSGAMTHELDTLVRQADTDENVGVVILTGTHPTRFLAHYDVSELLAGAKEAPPLSRARAKQTLSISRWPERDPRRPRIAHQDTSSGCGELASLPRHPPPNGKVWSDLYCSDQWPDRRRWT